MPVFDPSQRLLGLSFLRLPEEHAVIMMELGRRLSRKASPTSVLRVYLIMMAGGLAVGTVAVLYQRYVLGAFVPPAEQPRLGIVLLQILPFALALLIFLIWRTYWALKSMRRMLTAQIAPGRYVDVDIYEDGLESSCNGLTVQLTWSSVKSIAQRADRIEIEHDGLVVYLPLRAFPDRDAFNRAETLCRSLADKARNLPVVQT